ncbi:MAG TPA: response regulator [Candidatus Aquilonibacter sp.]|nr:response regulator [Candidatus Aquilonibacter sp.]
MMQMSAGILLPFPDPPPPNFRDFEGNDGAHDSLDSAGPLRIIVVDDETRIASTLVEILKDEGFDARSASTGDGALDLARSFTPDVVLSDVIIPGMNGIEVGIQISRLFPKCRVILFSGQAATLDLVKDARQRGHEFEILAKPIKPAALLAIIREAR